MPTQLPTPPRGDDDKKRSLLGVVLKTLMVVSALALTFMVLLQEQRYVNGQPGPLAGTFSTVMQAPAEYDSQVARRPN